MLLIVTDASGVFEEDKPDPFGEGIEPLAMGGHWIVSSRVLTFESGTGAFVERSLALGIENKRITRMLDADRFRRLSKDGAWAGEKVQDVGVQPVVPAFVNAHTHLSLAPLRGVTGPSARANDVVADVFFRVEQHLTYEDVRAFARVGALEALYFGVGEVWDHYYFGGAVAEALLEVGLPGVVAPTLQDQGGPFSFDSDSALRATQDIFASEKYRNAHIFAALGPHATDTVSDALLGRAADLARQLHVPLHMHLAQSISEARAFQQTYGRSFGEHLSQRLSGCHVLAAHGLYLNEADCHALAEAGWVLAYTPYSQLQFGFLGPLSTWGKAHGLWALGTDCVASNDSLDVQRELPIVGGEAALLASFSLARRQLLEGSSKASAEDVETERRRLLGENSFADSSALLRSAVGPSLLSLGLETARGIQMGAPARLLILKKDHPVLFPGHDLTRAHAYSPTVSAIDKIVLGDEILVPGAGILSASARQEILKEAHQRREALLVRAQMPSVFESL